MKYIGFLDGYVKITTPSGWYKSYKVEKMDDNSITVSEEVNIHELIELTEWANMTRPTYYGPFKTETVVYNGLIKGLFPIKTVFSAIPDQEMKFHVNMKLNIDAIVDTDKSVFTS